MFSSRMAIGARRASPGTTSSALQSRSGHRRLNQRMMASVVALSVATGAMALQASGAEAAAGSATAKITVGSKTYKLSGGACQVTHSAVNVGIGGSPNSLGLHASVHKGKFSNAQIGMVLGGTPLAITTDTGTVSAKGGTFKGSDVVSHSTVKGTFTC